MKPKLFGKKVGKLPVAKAKMPVVKGAKIAGGKIPVLKMKKTVPSC